LRLKLPSGIARVKQRVAAPGRAKHRSSSFSDRVLRVAGGNGVVERIVRFNTGREPERLRLKYEALCSGAFRFLRGTCHLFYEDWPKRTPLSSAPHTWISGDLHLENFGSYKGDDRIIYFDINDFDEAVLAPCTFELARFATSVLLGARDFGAGKPQATRLVTSFLDAYADALGRGKARRIERLVADGLVRDLLDALLQRTRRQLLDRRTERRGGGRRLKLGKRALPASPAQTRAVTALIASYARTQEQPGFYRVRDVARRVAGTGSLGVERYVVLVEGKGSPDDNYLLDLKEARPTALAPFVPCRQPRWANEAERVVTIQDRMQVVAPALLHAVTMKKKGYILRELQPSEDRLTLTDCGGRMNRLESVMRTMGKVTAWSQLRSAGRQGSAIADDLIAFAGRSGWQKDVLAYAQSYARQVTADWQAFKKAAEKGAVPQPQD
jgi:uncharacterized protein (DUF2252 family)